MTQTAVVVGAGPGLGLAVARRFAGEGLAVALVARDAGRLDAAAAQLASSGGTAAGFPADVADPDSLREALAAARGWQGEAQVLVYNPSYTLEAPPTGIDPAAFTYGLALGVTGFVVALQALAPAMRAAGRGTVLATGSAVAVKTSVGFAGLAAQKAALRSLALAAAEELAPEGVHVATVTIMGLLGSGPAFAPDRIAEEYWRLHVQRPEKWQSELVYRG